MKARGKKKRGAAAGHTKWRVERGQRGAERGGQPPEEVLSGSAGGAESSKSKARSRTNQESRVVVSGELCGVW